MEFYKILENIMEEKGLKVADVAKASGLTDSTVRSIFDRKQKKVALNVAFKLADGLGVSLERLNGMPEGHKKPAPALSADALQVARDYVSLDNYGQSAVKAIITEERRRVDDTAEEEAPATKTIPLFGNSFAAGRGEPDFGNMWTDYEVPADSAAEFAIPINGDSMEPYLHDGSIAFGIKRDPADGEVAALLVNGEYRVKQICRDSFRNLHLFSLNRARRDADETIWADSGRAVQCFGVILMEKKFPLPLD